MKHRDFHQLAIIKKEAKGYTSYIISKKKYKRHQKHKQVFFDD
jgi:hypothetical protein